jgi:hypothetical protein
VIDAELIEPELAADADIFEHLRARLRRQVEQEIAGRREPAAMGFLDDARHGIAIAEALASHALELRFVEGLHPHADAPMPRLHFAQRLERSRQERAK